jgi:vancomycin resistance protein VanW
MNQDFFFMIYFLGNNYGLGRFEGGFFVKDSAKKVVLVVIFVSLMIGGFSSTALFYRQRGDLEKRPNSLHISKAEIPDIGISESRENNQKLMYHPYGRPVEGTLMWENDRHFHEICAKYQTSIRMSAFQTTLPDPLPGEEYNVALAADIISGSVLLPNRIFSVNKVVGPYSRERGFREGPTYYGTKLIKTTGGGVCKIASTLYNVVALANLKIIERKQHGMLVPYVPSGQDATVAEGNKDFKFKNTTHDPILIWADTKDNTLYMAIYGRTKPSKVIWRHQIINRQDFKTIYQINSSLKPGEEKVVIEGAEGMTVKNWLEIENINGEKIRKDLGVDYYRPMIRVIERAPGTHE